MRISRRKRATAFEPTTRVARPARAGTSPTLASAGARGGDPTPGSAPQATTGGPTAPDAVPRATPASPPSDGSTSPRPPVAEESDDGDLDRFFAALREIVHDAREQVVLEGDEERARSVPVAAVSTDATSLAELAPTRSDPAMATPDRSRTELAPSTAELVASLEADRDLWRERAIVWRERAMGADLLVKALSAHMSDLQINLDDLRMAIRLLDKDRPGASEPSAELPAIQGHSSMPTQHLEPGG